MSEPILVQPTGPEGHMPPWLVDELIEDLRAEGLDARLSYEPAGGGGAVWEVVVLWVSARAGGAVISKVVDYAFKWLEDQFKKHPDVPRPRMVEIALYEGFEGTLHVSITKETADEEPVLSRTTALENFEQWTRRKPPEGVYPTAHPGDRVRVSSPAASKTSQRHAGQTGTVTRYAPGGGRYTVRMDDGREIKLWREEFTFSEAGGAGN